MTNLFRTVLTLLCLFYSTSVFAVYDWGDFGFGANADQAEGVATDQMGNTYVLGTYYGTSKTFDTAEGPVTLNSVGGSMDFFVIKYNVTGSIEWVRSYGGSGVDEGIRISTSANGVVGIVGRFSSPSLTIPSLPAIFNTGAMDGFLLTLDEDGDPQWIRGVGGSFSDFYYDVEVTENSILCVGMMSSWMAVAGGDISINNGAPGTTDILMTRFNLDGSVEWSVNYGGTGDEEARGVSTNGNRAYISGSRYPIVPGSFDLGDETSFTAYGQRDGYAAAFEISDPADFHWIRVVGGGGTDEMVDVSTDKDGGVYIHGSSNSATFFSAPLPGEPNSGSMDVYLVKLSEEDGTSLWLQHPKGLDPDYAHAVEADGCGNVYITGSYGYAGIAFVGIWVLPTSTTHNIYVAQYESDGTLVFGQTIMNSSFATGNDVAIDTDNGPVFVGEHQGTLFPAGLGAQPSLGSNDFYMVRRNVGVDSEWHHTSSSTAGEAKGVDVVVDSDGDIYKTGTFTGPTTLGQGGETVTLVGKGMYVAKYSSCGRLLWAAQTNTTGLDSRGITVDETNGWVYVCGNFGAPLLGNFGSGVSPDGESCGLGIGILPGPTSYVARYNMSDGCVLTVKHFTAFNTKTNGVACDAAGNVFLAQEFVDPIPRIRAIKFDVNLNEQWRVESQYLSSAKIAYVNDIVTGVTPSGEQMVYLTGGFNRELRVGAGPLNSVFSFANLDAYVWQLTDDGASGTSNWISKGGVDISAQGVSITCDPDGNAYATGDFSRNLGPEVFRAPLTLSAGSGGYPAAFVTRIDAGSGGVASWTTPITASHGAWGTGISGDRSGLYLTGYWHGGQGGEPLYFAPSQAIVPVPWTGDPDPAKHHLYLARYNYNDLPGGTWGRSSDGFDENRGRGVAVNNSGFSYTTGEYQGELYLPALELTSTPSIFDAFLLRTNKSGGVFMKQAVGAAPVTEAMSPESLQKGPKVFPNPSEGTFFVEFPLGVDGELKVSDLTGKILLEQKSSDSRSELKLDHLSKGIYLLNWTQENGTRGSKKLIIH